MLERINAPARLPRARAARNDIRLFLAQPLMTHNFGSITRISMSLSPLLSKFQSFRRNVGKVEKITSITCQTHGQHDCVFSLIGGKAKKIRKANGGLNAGAEKEEEKLQLCHNVGFKGLEYISANPTIMGFFMSGLRLRCHCAVFSLDRHTDTRSLEGYDNGPGSSWEPNSPYRIRSVRSQHTH